MRTVRREFLARMEVRILNLSFRRHGLAARLARNFVGRRLNFDD